MLILRLELLRTHYNLVLLIQVYLVVVAHVVEEQQVVILIQKVLQNVVIHVLHINQQIEAVRVVQIKIMLHCKMKKIQHGITLRMRSERLNNYTMIYKIVIFT